MEIPKLKIEPKKYTRESTVVSLRMPRDMIQAFDDIARVTGRTRSDILSMSLEFALKYMELSEKQEGE